MVELSPQRDCRVDRKCIGVYERFVPFRKTIASRQWLSLLLAENAVFRRTGDRRSRTLEFITNFSDTKIRFIPFKDSRPGFLYR
jgi:hypothetical protein